MASIRQMPSGKWLAEIRRKGLPSISRAFTSKVKAEEWARLIEVDIVNGDFRKKLELAGVPTLAEALGEYGKLVTPRKKGAAPELTRIGKLSRTEIAKLRLSDITQAKVAEYRDTRLGQASASTVRIELSLFSVVFDWYINEHRGGGLTDNPVTKVKKPKPPPGRDRRFAPDEEAKILDAALGNARKQGGGRMRSPEFQVIVIMAIDTAMRVSEILGLTWTNVDLENGVAYLKEGKTKNDEKREVPLSPRAIEALKTLPRADDKDDQIFHYTASGFKSVWKATLLDAGLEIGDLHFHDLRHESTSRLFENGSLNVIEVATITGHKDLKMLRRYTHLKAGDLRKKLYESNAPKVQAQESIEDKLARLIGMLDKGLINKKDFGAQKKTLLAQL